MQTFLIRRRAIYQKIWLTGYFSVTFAFISQTIQRIVQIWEQNLSNWLLFFYPFIVKLMKRASLISFSIRILVIPLQWTCLNSCRCNFFEKKMHSKKTRNIDHFLSLFVTLQFGSYTFQTHTVTNSYARYPLFFRWISQNVCTAERCLLRYFVSFNIIII